MRLGAHFFGVLAPLAVSVGCTARSDRVLPQTAIDGGVEVASVSALPPTFDPAYLWHFQVRQSIPTISPVTGDPVIFKPSAALLLSNGTLLVLDPSAAKPLVLLDPADGSVVAQFGKTGQGPGELGGFLALAESDAQIEVWDSSNRQLHRFSVSGEYLGSSRLTVNAQPWYATGAPDGHGYVVEVVHPDDGWKRELLRIDDAANPGTPLLRLPEPPADRESYGLQGGRALWTVVGERVVSMWSSRPVLHVHDAAGRAVREIYVPLTRRDLTERDIAQQVERYGNIASTLQPGAIALTNVLYPAGDSIFGMFMTALWHAAEDSPFPELARYWRLFTVRGEYLGVLSLPEDFTFLGTDGNAVWASVLDEKLEPVIEKLELVRGEGG